jgi:hypothetical protein
MEAGNEQMSQWELSDSEVGIESENCPLFLPEGFALRAIAQAETEVAVELFTAYAVDAIVPRPN